VVLLGRVEGAGVDDLGDHRTGQQAGLLDAPLRRLGEALLLGVVGVDRGAVLLAPVAELAILDRQVDFVPEGLQEPLVAPSPGRRRGTASAWPEETWS
jgi:hypothetical protein